VLQSHVTNYISDTALAYSSFVRCECFEVT
jgi:hypothetical protein